MQGISGETSIENRLMVMGRGEERVRCMMRVTRKFTLTYVKWIADGNLLMLCINLEAWDWEGASKGRCYMYTYGGFMLRFDRKQQNSVKQLSFNLKINKFLKRN